MRLNTASAYSAEAGTRGGSKRSACCLTNRNVEQQRPNPKLPSSTHTGSELPLSLSHTLTRTVYTQARLLGEHRRYTATLPPLPGMDRMIRRARTGLSPVVFSSPCSSSLAAHCISQHPTNTCEPRVICLFGNITQMRPHLLERLLVGGSVAGVTVAQCASRVATW